MKTCSHCGKNIDQNWNACPYCRRPIGKQSCPCCGKEIKPEWKACPYCGRQRNNDDIPDLPGEDELDEAQVPSAEEKAKAQRLLAQFEEAIAEYARETKPEFGKGFAMLFGAAKVPSPERCFSLRDQIYDSLDDHEARYEGPFWEMLCSKKKGRDTNEIIGILRDEVRYIETHLDLTAEKGGARTGSADKFICPGCAERATAKNASLCPTCNQYVHHDCAVKGFVRWSCPVCETGLVGQS